jgi:membrane protease YdiL (CAAX protease family)
VAGGWWLVIHFERVLSEPVEPPSSSPQPPPPAPAVAERIVALIEVLICSDYPTQLALGATFAALGYGPYSPTGGLRVGYVVGISLLDSVVLVGLVFLFLHSHGERPREVILGRRPVMGEIAHGLPLVLVAITLGIATLLSLQYLAPSLHTVEQNHLQQLLGRPRDRWWFALTVVVAGGIREEIQRAFLLHRFERWLGGGTVGLVITSTVFGAGHVIQGGDAVVATGLLGAFWGIIYLRRRSAVAAMVSHAGFDLLQVVQFLVAGR